MNTEISIKNDKVLVGLFICDIYFKLKTSNNIEDTQHHFRNVTSYHGSANVVNPDACTHWIVDKHTLSLTHADTSLHTTTLCVPKFEDVDKVIIK